MEWALLHWIVLAPQVVWRLSSAQVQVINSYSTAIKKYSKGIAIWHAPQPQRLTLPINTKSKKLSRQALNSKLEVRSQDINQPTTLKSKFRMLKHLKQTKMMKLQEQEQAVGQTKRLETRILMLVVSIQRTNQQVVQGVKKKQAHLTALTLMALALRAHQMSQRMLML